MWSGENEWVPVSELSRREIEQIARFFVAESMRVGRRNDGSGESVAIRYNTTDQSCVDFAPLETTANGSILFDEVAVPGFGKVTKLRLKFAEGRVVSVCDKDRIAELGIGCNPGAEYTGGSIIVDEKIYGTIHVAIGNNTGAYHGINKASSHLDMIKSMKQGELYVDGKLVMKDGSPVH